MRLCLLETKLSRDERELWHFLAGFLPHGGPVKLRQLLQLGLGELAGIGGDRVLLDTLPIQIFRQKPLQDIPLRSELWILLKLGFHDLVGNLRQALIDLHHHEQVLSSLAMALCISQSNDRGEHQGNRDQARAKQHSHDTILLGIGIPHAGGTYPWRGGRLPCATPSVLESDGGELTSMRHRAHSRSLCRHICEDGFPWFSSIASSSARACCFLLPIMPHAPFQPWSRREYPPITQASDSGALQRCV